MSDDDDLITALRALVECYPGLTFTRGNIDRYVALLRPLPIESVRQAIASWAEEDNEYFPKAPQLVARTRSLLALVHPPQRPSGVPVRGTIVTGLMRTPALTGNEASRLMTGDQR